MASLSKGALQGLTVLDFSTLLPGPMASLLLAEAGAKIYKLERPPSGDEMRRYEPKIGDESVNFVMLNRNKHSINVDLKAADAIELLRPLLETADVLIEQFRPGVMARLGLGYSDVRKINPKIIFCSITGWGQTGPKSAMAGHDLNYVAETGILGLSVGSDGAPILPPLLSADIAGGTYPAVINILLALIRRDRTGEGAWIDIAMGENLLPFLYWALGNAQALGQWPVVNGETVTGGSPRYGIYRTRDHRYMAAAPLEDKFWLNFTSVIGLPAELCRDDIDPRRTREAVAQLIAERDSAEWLAAFEHKDVCCSIVATLQEVLGNTHWQSRETFSRQTAVGNAVIPALPTVIVPILRSGPEPGIVPSLGKEGELPNADLLELKQ